MMQAFKDALSDSKTRLLLVAKCPTTSSTVRLSLAARSRIDGNVCSLPGSRSHRSFSSVSSSCSGSSSRALLILEFGTAQGSSVLVDGESAS